MPHPSTVKKVADFLVYIRKRLKKEPYLALSEELKVASLAPDYTIVLTQEGVIEKVDSGKRGPTCYAWNDEHIADMQTAFKLVMEYNKLRREQQRIREGQNPRITNQQHLVDIKGMVLEILDHVKKYR